MGRHTEWRKIAKKMRRKRLRSKLARLRDAQIEEEERKSRESPSYGLRLAAQAAAREADELRHAAEERRWREEEERATEEFNLRQALLQGMKEVEEKKRLTEKLDKEEKENAFKEKEERLKACLYDFALGERASLPAELLVPVESQPGLELCPFYSKVAACRFSNTCSRNHIRPALSNTLLFPGFYTHFTLSTIGYAEYDTDMTLEYDDKETYAHFLEFYSDIRTELESCGRLSQLVVCSNASPQLRGNVYVAFSTERAAMSAYLKFNGRFYAGKQISCHFVNIPSWKSAICGLHFRKKCPKGNQCNFLHIFKNPGPPINFESSSNRESPKSWRWSESPEREESPRGEKRRRRSRVGERSRAETRRERRTRENSDDRSRRRSSERRLEGRRSREKEDSSRRDRKRKSSEAKRDKESREKSSERGDNRLKRRSRERRTREESSERKDSSGKKMNRENLEEGSKKSREKTSDDGDNDKTISCERRTREDSEDKKDPSWKERSRTERERSGLRREEKSKKESPRRSRQRSSEREDCGRRSRTVEGSQTRGESENGKDCDENAL